MFPALGKLNGEELDFQVSLGYIVGLCLKKKKKRIILERQEEFEYFPTERNNKSLRSWKCKLP
jgi:hypothetical protein